MTVQNALLTCQEKKPLSVTSRLSRLFLGMLKFRKLYTLKSIQDNIPVGVGGGLFLWNQLAEVTLV